MVRSTPIAWHRAISQERSMRYAESSMISTIQTSPGTPLAGKLLYRAGEYSFAYEVLDPEELERRVGSEGVTSLVVDTLRLEIGVETGELLFAWGYLPEKSWDGLELPHPILRPGMIRLEERNNLEPGISLSLSRNSKWRVEFDSRQGWLRIARHDFEDESAIQIADDVAIGVWRGSIAAIWLRPTFVG